MAERQIAFLMYHELEVPTRPLCQSEPGYVRYILRVESFRLQMRWLAANGWSGLSVSEALEYPSGKNVALTFDDGCETDLISAAPILREHGFRATSYVTAGFIGKPGYLSPTQVRELRDSGFEIGCHSMTHAYLDDVDTAALRREVIEAGEKLEQLLGEKIAHFSCPGGRYDQRAVDFIINAGYRSLATSRVYVNSRKVNPYALGRVPVLRKTDQSLFDRMCSGKALWRMSLAESTRAAAKRALGNTLYDDVRRLLLRYRESP